MPSPVDHRNRTGHRTVRPARRSASSTHRPPRRRAGSPPTSPARSPRRGWRHGTPGRFSVPMTSGPPYGIRVGHDGPFWLVRLGVEEPVVPSLRERGVPPRQGLGRWVLHPSPPAGSPPAGGRAPAEDAGAGFSTSSGQPQVPKPDRRTWPSGLDLVEDLHGRRVTDLYRTLADPANPGSVPTGLRHHQQLPRHVVWPVRR
jgi:hypothetical protein